MKKIIVLLLAVFICFLLAACSDNFGSIGENEISSSSNAETKTHELDSNAQAEDLSSSVSTGAINLEDVTSAYVEPDFKVVSTLAECYDYFEPDANDTVSTEKNPDGTVALITVTDKDGNTKSTMKFTYNDKIVATATFFEADGTTEKVVAFSFYDENTLNIIAHISKESEMSLYLYNEDGSFNSYVDSAGFSSLLVSSVMQGLGGAFSQ